MIGDFLEQAEWSLLNDRHAVAVALLGIAIDATAKREFPELTNGHQRFVKLVSRDLGLATKIAFGNAIETLNIAIPETLLRNTTSLERVPDYVYGAESNMYSLSLAEILYRPMRSEAVHSASLPNHIELIAEDRIVVRETVLQLPISILMGFLVTTIIAETNCDEAGRFIQPIHWHRLGAASRLEWLFGKRSDVEGLVNSWGPSP